MMAHFVSLGSAAQKLLNKSGFAYGSIVRIAHSDKDKEVQQSSRLGFRRAKNVHVTAPVGFNDMFLFSRTNGACPLESTIDDAVANS